MFSMTGYGKGVCAEEGVELTAEVKSVNNRYLDLAIKSPRIFLAQEERIRAIAREHISRGHVDIFISYTDKREKEKSYYVDLSVARAYHAAAGQIKAALPDVPDVVRAEETSAADELLEHLVERSLHEAFASLSEMRKKEGERLKADLLSRMSVIETLTETIAVRAPRVAEEYRKKLADRIQEFLAGKADEARILTEAAIFADKSSIDEELTRLRAHIKAFREICLLEQVGRKLDFLVQEFNRECNTICSKSSDQEITANALQMKNEIEKVREQIQNLE